MDWLKLSADFWTNPKLQAVTNQAYRAVTSSWGYAARHETDGRIPASAYRLLGATPRVVEELHQAELWHPNGDGSVIHDWDDHQEAAASLKEDRGHKRRLARERQAAKRARDREAQRA